MEESQQPLLPRLTFPLSHSARQKPRRWPLVLRLWKGSIHLDILPAVVCHAALSALIVWLDKHMSANLALPGTIVPSLSIVVGLMLVFRNGTSYDRFWNGRNHLTTIVTCVRNLTRTFLIFSAPYDCPEDMSEDEHELERQETDTAVRTLISILYAVKRNLRAEWRSESTPIPLPLQTSTFGTKSRPGSRHHSRTPTASKRPDLFRSGSGLSIFQGTGLPNSFYNDQDQRKPVSDGQQDFTSPTEDLRRSAILNKQNSGNVFGNISNSTSTILGTSTSSTPQRFRRSIDYGGLLPSGLGDFEDQGLSLPIQLSVLIEGYIARQLKKGRLTAPQGASQLAPQLNTLIDAFGRMETIRTTPLPVAHLIHTKQVLTLYLIILPFTLVAEMAWWTIGIVALVAFTLYGIEGIGSQLEDPFGYDRNDVKMDGIVEDARVEGMCLLNEWRRGGEMFARF